uniref:hypothetical protein n=1 Tax=Pseudomonas aeruginosa TaxID=287 RepID=UPI003892660E
LIVVDITKNFDDLLVIAICEKHKCFKNMAFQHFASRAGPGSGRAGFSKIPSRPVKKVSRPESRTEVSQQSRPESRPDPKIPSRPEIPKIPKISMFFLKTKIKPQKTGETYYSVANTAH